MKDSYATVFESIQKILVVMAHPDDAEIVCGGLLARAIRDGKDVRLVVCTDGSKGFKGRTDITPAELAAAREKETAQGAKALGIPDENVYLLHIPDGEFEHNLENIENVVFHIRQFQPDIVITHNPQDTLISYSESSHWVNHRDHRYVGACVFDGVYPYSRDRGFFPAHFDEGLEPAIVKKLLVSDSYNTASVMYFDIKEFAEVKKQAIASHPSQFDEETAASYLEENEYEGGYYEPLAYYEIY